MFLDNKRNIDALLLYEITYKGTTFFQIAANFKVEKKCKFEKMSFLHFLAR